MKTENHYDVVIVGSGPGGGASAWALTRQGLKVLILDAGPAYDPFLDYKLDLPSWEQSRFPHKIPITGRQTFAPMQRLDKKWQDLFGPVNGFFKAQWFVFPFIIPLMHGGIFDNNSRINPGSVCTEFNNSLCSLHCFLQTVPGKANHHLQTQLEVFFKN